MRKDVKDLADNLKDNIGAYPNTYTYTKGLAEKRLMQTREHVNLVIYRPSIIACAYREPFRAWTDSLSAAGGLSLLSALGLMKYVHGDGSNPFDVIPVDYIVNGILITSCKGAKGKNYFEVYNAGSTDGNMITMKDYRDLGLGGYKNHRYDLQQFPALVNFIPSELEFKIRK
jgi:hypothetical protein